ncbi:MAG: hypothetical protein JNM14_08270 [Ferruginibacter sp.]|nr:hypothetical protein [Ferruginibacter sp.]
MIRNLSLVGLLSLFIVFANSCTKDPESGANPGGTSVYSFDGNPGTCATPTIAGLYRVGYELNATNTITINVNVVAKGSYAINTTGVNGVSFFGSGVFSTTGPQTVVLTGRGTPQKKGNFSFVPTSNNTCNFSVSFLDGAPTAVFTYAGGTSNCTAPVISGTYASGVALGSGNYVDLGVNVTTPGAYTVSTNSAGGISFSGSGAFTATGAQVIRLIGNGTPSGAGTFTFTPSGGCSFNVTVAPPPPPAAFTYTCAAPTISGTYTAGTALNATNTIVVPVNVTVAGLYSVTTNADNGVTFSASGVFAGTGAQTITLRSTNTPTAAGTFSYTPSGAGCSFDITYTGGGGGGGDYLRCKINGVLTDFSDGMIGTLDNGSSPYLFDVEGFLVGGSDGFSISIQDDNNLIAAGAFKNFSLSNQNKFCNITYTPGSAFWLSSLLNANTFTVNITSVTATTVTGTFSGTLYENSTGPATKSITEGVFSVAY